MALKGMMYSAGMSKSKLVLGTVQFGMPYGLHEAQPSKDTAFGILDEAYKRGITTFDTAQSYGSAEEVLGEWIQRRGLEKGVYVTSKLRASAPSEPGQIRTEIEGSLKRLHLSKLDGYLLHAPERMQDEAFMKEFRGLKDSGLADNTGVSIYDEKEALKAARMSLEYIQIPYNALDQRLDKTDFFDVAAENNVTIFARSALLQGVLVTKIDEIPTHLSHIRPFVETFQQIAKDADLTPLAAAFQYVYAQEHINHVVFGVQSVEQLLEIFDAIQSTANPSFIAACKKAFVNVPREVVHPQLWKGKRA